VRIGKPEDDATRHLCAHLDDVVVGHERPSETSRSALGQVHTHHGGGDTDRDVEHDLVRHEDPELAAEGGQCLDQGSHEAKRGEEEERLFATVSLVEPRGDHHANHDTWGGRSAQSTQYPAQWRVARWNPPAVPSPVPALCSDADSVLEVTCPVAETTGVLPYWSLKYPAPRMKPHQPLSYCLIPCQQRCCGTNVPLATHAEAECSKRADERDERQLGRLHKSAMTSAIMVDRCTHELRVEAHREGRAEGMSVDDWRRGLRRRLLMASGGGPRPRGPQGG
jgi:hypothetical protein